MSKPYREHEDYKIGKRKGWNKQMEEQNQKAAKIKRQADNIDWKPPSPSCCLILSLSSLMTTAFLSVKKGSPKTTAIRMIEWYQENISAGKNLCPRGEGKNCSSYGLRSIRNYGLLIGGIMTLVYLITCRSDYNHPKGCCKDSEDCCTYSSLLLIRNEPDCCWEGGDLPKWR